MWQKPDDLELIAECETEHEALLIKGLLETSGIHALMMIGSESSINTLNFRVFGDPPQQPRKPFKVLVHPEAKAEAEALLASPAEGDDSSQDSGAQDD